MKKQHLYYAGGILMGSVLLFVLHRYLSNKFDLSVFDSPDLKGSGKNMDKKFLSMLKKVEKFVGLELKFSSGYRTKAYNARLKASVPNSAHTKGLGVDIKADSIQERDKIIEGAVKAGFKRIGIGNTFVHLDNDLTKPLYVAWGYPIGKPAPYNPFTRYSNAA